MMDSMYKTKNEEEKCTGIFRGDTSKQTSDIYIMNGQIIIENNFGDEKPLNLSYKPLI